MSGKLQPTMEESPRSMDAGNGKHVSPLKIFGQAKKSISNIFSDISKYTLEALEFLEDKVKDTVVYDENDTLVVRNSKDKGFGILDVMKRDHMKVVFFGRTSNGKSTVINAMLRQKILPSGIGHTTNCFLQIEGIDGQDPYLLTACSKEPKEIGSVGQLASALHKDTMLTCDALVRIMWPSHQCHLLKDDVILLDSPGIDVSGDLDTWIVKHCLDADVFILVANAESTLMQAEKNFFHKVAERLSKPNIFILNNRWDMSMTEPETSDMVKQQHLDTNIRFLCEELQVMTKREAQDRVFFVSAKETLATRVPKGAPGTPSGNLAEGFQVRTLEFQDFEKKFEQCISASAVRTKFEQHCLQGARIVSDVHLVMTKVHKAAGEQREECVRREQEVSDHLAFITSQLDMITLDIKDRIQGIVEEVTLQVGAALSEEIRRLPSLVDDFHTVFHPDPIVLNQYKKDLHQHVETGIGKNLNSRCSRALEATLISARQEMTERLVGLVSADQQHQVLTKQLQSSQTRQSQQFSMAYLIDCHNLCQDFQEDIEFRFSWGLTSIINKFSGRGFDRRRSCGTGLSAPRSLLSTPQTPSNRGGAGLAREPTSGEQELMMQMIANVASATSRTTMGLVVVGGVLWRAVGWRILAISLGAYGMVYVYERLTYTNKAKERRFKEQYVRYVTQKLKLIVDLTSANCSHQIQQELAATFASLCGVVDGTKEDLLHQLDTLRAEIRLLQDMEKNSKALRNKADFLKHELDEFVSKYLHE